MSSLRARQLSFGFLITLTWLLSACGVQLSPTPTVAPTLTATSAPSATPAPTPTRTPAPTPRPPLTLSDADHALFEGDWALALQRYQTVLEQNTASEIRAAAHWGRGRARLAAGDAVGAIAELNTLLTQYTATPLLPETYFLLGEAYRANAQWAEAIGAYEQYLRLRPGELDSYVEERLAWAAVNSGAYPTAAQAYRAALGTPRTGALDELRENLASVLMALADFEGALEQYTWLADNAAADWRKARAQVLMGQAFYNRGQTEEAYAHFLEAVNRYPEAGDSFSALVTLVNDEIPVDDMQRGLTNFAAQNYEPALAAFQRRLDDKDAGADAGDKGTAWFYMGRTYAALGDAAQALAAFRQVITNYPADANWAQAYFQVAFIQDYPDDAQTFLALVAAAPQTPDAPDALYRAARLHERYDNLAQAAQVWTRLATDYPTSALAADAALQAGFALYRANDLTTALQRFNLASTLGTDPAQHARAWLWMGKLKQQQGAAPAARAAWEAAAALDPDGYYGLRAEALLRGETALFVPPLQYSFEFDVESEKAESEIWLRANLPQLPATGNLSALPAAVQNDGRFTRGAALWRLGLLTEAHAEFDDLRRALSQDPAALWPLALYFNDLGVYDLGIRAARQLVDLAGFNGSVRVPRLIVRLRYPAPFAEHVQRAAADYDLHPFFMLSKMRLESFFWKYAFSSAEARGLNQIIPATADDIARRLGLTDFVQEDLYRPVVSIPMGAFYLHYVGTLTAADPAAMLVGYYAGPGNAQTWQALAHGDPDLFLEVMRLPDARGYVQTAYAYFAVYSFVYANP